MKIGILSKRKGNFAGEIQKYLEIKGHEVKILTANDLNINDMLLNRDLYILKSKHLLYLYAGYFLCPNIFMGTFKTLKSQLQESNFPLISKPMHGSGSRGVKVYHSLQDFNVSIEDYLYLENFIKGTHYLAYFIENEICICKKRPLSNEHQDTELIESDKDIEKYLIKWKEKNNLLFGHLDLVRETNTNKLFVVDAGTFPEFSNWKHDTDPTSKICDLILKEYRILKN